MGLSWTQGGIGSTSSFPDPEEPRTRGTWPLGLFFPLGGLPLGALLPLQAPLPPPFFDPLGNYGDHAIGLRADSCSLFVLGSVLGCVLVGSVLLKFGLRGLFLLNLKPLLLYSEY